MAQSSAVLKGIRQCLRFEAGTGRCGSGTGSAVRTFELLHPRFPPFAPAAVRCWPSRSSPEVSICVRGKLPLRRQLPGRQRKNSPVEASRDRSTDKNQPLISPGPSRRRANGHPRRTARTSCAAKVSSPASLDVAQGDHDKKGKWNATHLVFSRPRSSL